MKFKDAYGKGCCNDELQHADCHGWTHCESSCCGPCPYCGESADSSEEPDDDDYDDD